MPAPSDRKMETTFTFAAARHDNFVDDAGASSLYALQKQQEDARKRQEAKEAHAAAMAAAASPTASPASAASSASPAASPASAASAASPSPASPPQVSQGGPIDLSVPQPRTKVIPPPRNHILTRHLFRAQGSSPGARCGFSATLVQRRPEDPASMFVLGGADENTLRGDAYLLHIHAQQWERIECETGGPGALFGHSAICMEDGKIYVFGGLTYSSTFDFTPTASPAAAAASPASSVSSTASAASPAGRWPAGASPLSTAAAAARSAEEEDDEARRRFAAAKLAAKLGDLRVQKPLNPHAANHAGASTALDSLPDSANSSPKLVDAAGSPGGGVGHEEEDANTEVETVGIEEGEARARGGLTWRAMAATGSGLLTVARMPWKAVKQTGKVVKKVGKVSVTALKAVGSAVGVGPGSTPVAPPTKSQQYGVDSEKPEVLRPEIDGEKIHVQLGPAAGGINSFTSPRASPGSLLSSKAGYARAGSASGSNSDGRFTLLGRGSSRVEVPSAGLFVFDPASRQWAHEVDVRGVPPSPRYMHSACAFPELQCVYFFGGAQAREYGQSCNDLWKLDLRSRTWTLVPPKGRVPCRRHGHSATNIGHGHMLVFGGANEDMDSKRGGSHDGVRRFNDTYIFDTATEIWHAITTYGSPPMPRAFHMAALQAERYLYLVSGETSSQSSDCCVLDLNHMVWSRPLFDGSFEQTLHGGVSLALNNKILVYGGLNFSHDADGSGGLSSDAFLLNTVEVVGQRDDFTELQIKILVVGAAGVGKTSLIRRFVEDRFIEGKGTPLGAPFRTVLTLIAGRLVKIHVHDVPADASLEELARVRAGARGSEKSAGGALLDAVDGALLVYDPSNPDSLDCLDSWSEQIHAANADLHDGGWKTASQTGIFVPPENPKDPLGEKDAELAAAAAKKALSPTSPPIDADEGGIEGTGLASKSRVRVTVLANKSDMPRALRQAVPSSAGKALASKLSAQFVAASARDSSGVDAAFLEMARKLVKDRLHGRNQGGCIIS